MSEIYNNPTLIARTSTAGDARLSAELAAAREVMTKLTQAKWPNEMSDKDMFGVHDFRQWFDSTYPVPRTKAQKGNRKGKENVAYGAWAKCEELYANFLSPVIEQARAALAAKEAKL